MQTLVTYAGLAAISSVLAFGANASASLSPWDGTAILTPRDVVDLARKGADDTNSNDRHGRGRDDGPDHAENAPAILQIAQNGGHDGGGHEGGGHGGTGHDGGRHDGGGHDGMGHGGDDGAAHDARGRGVDDGLGHIRRAHRADDTAGDDHGG